MMKLWTKALTAAVLAAGLAVAVGCTKPPATSEAPKEEKEEGHGWWCVEHGVVESECTMCNAKLYKEAKAKGALCPNHPDRAKDQCFICNPELWEKSAARYKEKYDKEPPLPDENTPGKR